MHTSLIIAMLQLDASAAQGWEVAKGVMLTLTTAGVMWSARTLLSVRDRVRDLSSVVMGRDGSNGLKSASKDHEERIQIIEERHSNLDAIAEFEKAQHPGPDRRHENRRLRDQAFPNPLDETPE